MVAFRRAATLAAVIVVATLAHGAAQVKSGKTVLLGTLGACNNQFPGGPCQTSSTLVQIDPETGALIKTIGPVGFTVNGLAWDATTATLYATTPPGDVRFHGLLTIDLKTGAGTPVNPAVVNFGLAGAPSPIHSITVDFFGRMVGWYDEFPAGVVTDTFVRIDKRTGVATEFPNTGIDTAQNGLSFSDFNLLWNIDSPKFDSASGGLVQFAYLLNPLNGVPFLARPLSPPTAAALGDFNPDNNLYYGLNFETSTPPPFPTSIVVVDLPTGTTSTLAPTVDDLHTLAFLKKARR